MVVGCEKRKRGDFLHIVNKIYHLSLVCLLAGVLAGCGVDGSVRDSSDTLTGSASALPAYSTVFGTDAAKQKSVSAVAADEKTAAKPFDFYSGGTPTHAQLETAAQEYEYWTTDETSFTMNGAGQFLSEKDIHVSRIQDVLTQETKYYAASHKTYKKLGEWDYDVKMMSRLYDPDGKLISDWTEIQYTDCIGDWVRMQKYRDFSMAADVEDNNGKLWNVKTGEERAHVWYMNKVSNAAVFVQSEDSKSAFTVDAQGNVLYDFTALQDELAGEYTFSSYWNYIVAEEPENGLYRLSFYSPEGKKLGKIENVESSYIDDTMILQPYVSCDGSIYDPSAGDGGDLTPVFWMGETRYYDGELAICGTYQSDGSLLYRLYDAKTGEALSGEYAIMEARAAYDGEKMQAASLSFVAVRDGRLEKLDRHGTCIAEKNIGNVSYVMLYEDAIVVDCISDDGSEECLLDMNLQPVLPEGKYVSIWPLYDRQDTAHVSLWAGEYYLDKEQMHVRADLFTTDGTILMQGASSFGTLADGKISVTRGLSMGLIDEKGNWVLKVPKYKTGNDD